MLDVPHGWDEDQRIPAAMVDDRANPDDPPVHGRFESRFVDAIALTSDDIQADIPAAMVLPDAFDAVIAHLDAAATHVEEVYRLDKARAFQPDASASSPNYARAKTLVRQ